MANYLSQKIDYIEPFKAVNTQLVGQVLAAKQGQYNLAKQQITQTLDAFENLKVLRPQDQEYITAKITDLRNTLDASAYKDFSDINLSDNLMGQIKSAAKDPFIIDAIANTTKFNNYQQQIANLKTKEPKLYSDANYAYSLYKGGVQDYISGKTNGIGSLSYTPYTDLSEEHLKRLKTIKDIKGKRFIEELSPDGKFKIRKEIDGLTDNEILNYFSSTMSPQEVEQMRINGWSKYGQDKNRAIEIVNSFNKEQIDQLETEIAKAQADLSNTNLPQAKRDKAASDLEKLRNQKDSIITKFDDIPVEDIAFQIEKNSYLNGLSQLAKSEWSTSFDVNQAYYKDRELEIAYEKLAMDKEKNALETAKLRRELGVNADGTPATAEVTISAREGELEEVQGVQSYRDEHNYYYNNILETGAQLYNKVMSAADKDKFDATLRARGINPETMRWNDPVKNSNYSLASTIVEAFEATGLTTTYSTQAKQLQESLIKKQNIAVDLTNVDGNAIIQTFSKDPDKYVDGLKRMRDDLQPTFSIISDVVGGQQQTQLQNRIDSFVDKVGGWDNVKNAVSKDKKLAYEFAQLTDQADKTYKGIDPYIKTALAQANPFGAITGLANRRTAFTVSDINLQEDSRQTAETILKGRSKEGSLAYFTSYNTATFSNEADIDRIIRQIPANRYINMGENSALFDPKKSVSVYKQGENIVVEQYLGTKGSGEKEQKNIARVILHPEDTAFKEITKSVELEQSKKGLDASRTFINIPSARPNYVDRNRDRDQFKNQVESLQETYQNLGVNKKIFAIDPTSFIDDVQIEDTFIKNFSTIYGRDKVQELTDSLTDSLRNWSVTPIVKSNKGVATWGLQIRNANNKEVVDESINVQNLNEDMQYLIRNYPQTIIGNYIFLRLAENKTEKNFNSVLNDIRRE